MSSGPAAPSTRIPTTTSAPSASYSLTVRLEIENKPGMLGKVTSAIGKAGGDIGAVDLVEMTGGRVLRDITIKASDSQHGQAIIDSAAQPRRGPGGQYLGPHLPHAPGRQDRDQEQGPDPHARRPLHGLHPGVARVCLAIKEDPSRAFTLTIKHNTVAVVTDGTAVLGLGDIGPEAAMPVMEGKAMLFKELAGVDAFPDLPQHQGSRARSSRPSSSSRPAFGGINLEDISAPRCFEVESRLRKELDIPVFHDDQHGTAVVVLAALLNALKIVKKDRKRLKVVVSGVGAAGTATIKILLALGVRNIIGVDEHGTIHRGRKVGMDFMKSWVAEATNPGSVRGRMSDAIRGADVFIGLSVPGVLTVKDVKSMARDRIVFAMANPDAGDPARGGGAARARDGHRPLGLPEPDQQRALLPGLLPRAPRLARAQSSTTR